MINMTIKRMFENKVHLLDVSYVSTYRSDLVASFICKFFSASVIAVLLLISSFF